MVNVFGSGRISASMLNRVKNVKDANALQLAQRGIADDCESATASAAWEHRRLYRYILDRVKNAKRSEVSAAGASALQLAQRWTADDCMKNAKRSEAGAAGASSLQLAQRGEHHS